MVIDISNGVYFGKAETLIDLLGVREFTVVHYFQNPTN